MSRNLGAEQLLERVDRGGTVALALLIMFGLGAGVGGAATIGCGRIHYDSVPGADAGVDGGPSAPLFLFAVTQVSNVLSVYSVNDTTGTPGAMVATHQAGLQPRSLALHPRLSFAYVYGDAAASDGLFTMRFDPVGPVLVETLPRPVIGTFQTQGRLAVHPTLDALYLGADGPGSSNLFQFHSDTSNSGLLSPLAPPNVETDSQPAGIAIRPQGDYAYVAASASTVISSYTLDPSTGAATLLNLGAANISAAFPLAMHPTGNALYAGHGTGVDVYSIQPANGALAPLGTLPTAARVVDLALTPDGRFLFGITVGGDLLRYTVTAGSNLSAGDPALGAFTDPRAIAVDPGSRFAYVADAGRSEIRVFAIGADGELAPGNPLSLTGQPVSLALRHY